jgi:hypothetical protein
MSDLQIVQDLLGEDKAPQPALRSPPLNLFLYDLWIVIRYVIPHLNNAFFPLAPRGGIFHDITPSGLVFQIILVVWSLLLYIPLILLGILVGGVTPLLVAYALAWPFYWIQGNPIVTVPAKISTIRDPAQRRNSKEAWLFINGIATSRTGVILVLRRLEVLFQRPVVGILNKSLGLFADLLECVVQRDVLYATESVRFGYMETRKKLEDEKIEKVVLICHSQGGIIASLILDQLMTDLPGDLMKKLEVYTFGNAANHFSNPTLKVSLGSAINVIPHIEHYANGKDPVADIGVLAFQPSRKKATAKPLPKANSSPPTTSAPGLRFKGRLFARWNTSGHLLLSN